MPPHPRLSPSPAVMADKHPHACSEDVVERRVGHVLLRTAGDKDTDKLGPKRREGNASPLLAATGKQKGRAAIGIWL